MHVAHFKPSKLKMPSFSLHLRFGHRINP